jgi:hypothetical protein
LKTCQADILLAVTGELNNRLISFENLLDFSRYACHAHVFVAADFGRETGEGRINSGKAGAGIQQKKAGAFAIDSGGYEQMTAVRKPGVKPFSSGPIIRDRILAGSEA